MTNSTFDNIAAVSAVMRRDSKVVLVEQPIDSGRIGWSLPGGVVEGPEDIVSAVNREIREETGLRLGKPVGLAYMVRYVRLSSGDITTAFVFDAVADGEIEVNDPSGEVLRAKFFPVSEAITLLKDFPIEVMAVPAIAYLSTEIAPGTLWVYEECGGCVYLRSRTRTAGSVIDLPDLYDSETTST